MSEARVASLDEVTPGAPKLVEVHGVRVVLTCAGDQVYACGDTCWHRGGPLSLPSLSGPRLAYPWHGWMYDVRTGQCLFPARGTRAVLPGPHLPTRSASK